MDGMSRLTRSRKWLTVAVALAGGAFLYLVYLVVR